MDPPPVPGYFPNILQDEKSRFLNQELKNGLEVISLHLLLGKTVQDILQTKDNKIITEGIGCDSLLVAVAKNQAKLGLILFRLGKAASKIKEAI